MTTPTGARKTVTTKVADSPATTVTVAIDGNVYTYPDVSERYDAWRMSGNVRLIGRWVADRIAAQMFGNSRSLESMCMWVHMDDNPVAYLVQYTRKPRARMPRATIVGAARYGADPVEGES